ncbi:phosphoglucomutase (alpha-D-glucose-1,6-bisphosphate-dependent) [Hydrogenimonas sp.]
MTHPLAGKPVPKSELADIPALISAYYEYAPDLSKEGERVSFGTSGHRGSALKRSFNETHVLAITQAVCDYRKEHGIDGPLFMGIDTHALSTPAQMSALRVLAANGVKVKIAEDGVYTPTPLVSFAILEANGEGEKKADGIVVTPSHNPPEDGGFKYNPPNGGPAESDITAAIEKRANALIEEGLRGVKRIGYEETLASGFVERHDFITPYVEALGTIVDMEAIAASGLHLAADPLGGSAIGVYRKIKERYGVNLEIVNPYVDPTFSFMTLDRDGKIRMDCSSPWAMASLVGLKERYDLAFGNDTDADRHGIVTPVGGLMNPNHFLSVAIWYLFGHRGWPETLKIGKTLVSSSMIDRIAGSLGREVYEVPVGFKWFADGLFEGWLGFGGEESAGATFLRFDGSVWTTDKDGIVLAMLAAEIRAKTGRDPAEIYAGFEKRFGKSYYTRLDAPAAQALRERLKSLRSEDIRLSRLGPDRIEKIYTKAPGNGAPIGGLKIVTENGWVAMRPSGTEEIYKIYAESFLSQEHLSLLLEAAQKIVSGLTGPNR